MLHISIKAEYLRKFPLRQLLSMSVIEMLSSRPARSEIVFLPQDSGNYQCYTVVEYGHPGLKESERKQIVISESTCSKEDLRQLIDSLVTCNSSCVNTDAFFNNPACEHLEVPIGTDFAVFEFMVYKNKSVRISRGELILRFTMLSRLEVESSGKMSNQKARRLFKEELKKSGGV